MARIICGIDVSDETLDGSVGWEGPSIRVARTVEGIAQLRAFCADHDVELVVMEATGGYEKLLFKRLWEAGQPCAVVNPRQVRRFAEAMGCLEKTDTLDAGVIARFALARRILAQEPLTASQEHLRALVTRLRQLTQAKVAQLNQRRLIEDQTVLAMIDEIVAMIRRHIRDLELRIARLLHGDPLWQALDSAFRQIKGVADRTVATLAAELPEIGTYSNKAIAKLAGLAPMARDSGKHHGKRSIRGGRSQVRSILVIVAAVVVRHDPLLAAFHQRLTQAGKPKMAVRVAVAHKLLVQLNAKARDARAALHKA